MPSSLGFGRREGGSLGSLRGCRYGNQTKRAGPPFHSPTFGQGKHPVFPNLELITEASYLIGISELEQPKGDEEETRKPMEILKKNLPLGETQDTAPNSWTHA